MKIQWNPTRVKRLSVPLKINRVKDLNESLRSCSCSVFSSAPNIQRKYFNISKWNQNCGTNTVNPVNSYSSLTVHRCSFFFNFLSSGPFEFLSSSNWFWRTAKGYWTSLVKHFKHSLEHFQSLLFTFLPRATVSKSPRPLTFLWRSGTWRPRHATTTTTAAETRVWLLLSTSHTMS